MKGNKKKETKPPPVEQAPYVPKSIMPNAAGLALVIAAKPNSKESKITEINDEYIGVAIAAPPKEGEANEELLSHLALVLGVKKNTVYLDKGSKSRNKVAIIENKGLTLNQAYELLIADLNN
jgi:uncharacterized protein (TIGR00251 family)